MLNEHTPDTRAVLRRMLFLSSYQFYVASDFVENPIYS